MTGTKKRHKTKDIAGLRDKLIGKRIRRQREMLGITQCQLAERLGLTFQQIQKYEAGFNKLSAARLLDISVALETPIEFFFEAFAQRKDVSISGKDKVIGIGIRLTRESGAFLRNYYRIEDTALRQSVYAMMRRLAVM